MIILIMSVLLKCIILQIHVKVFTMKFLRKKKIELIMTSLFQ